MRKTLFCFAILMLLAFTILQAQVDVSIGDGTQTNSSTGAPAPYGTWYKAFRQQFIVLASELMDQGGGPGNINALAFNVDVLNNTTPMNNFRIRLKHTNQTALSTTFETGSYQQVFQQNSFTPTLGWNVHTFSAPFNWDGASNLLVDIVTDAFIGNYAQNASVFYTQTSFASSLRFQSDYDNGDTATTGTPANMRSNMKFTIQQLDVRDLSALSITGNTTPIVGSIAPYTITIKNKGQNIETNYTVKLMQQGGGELASVAGPAIESMQTLPVVVNWTPVNTGNYVIYGEVVMADDDIADNNSTSTLSVTVLSENIGVIDQFPYLEDFDGVWTGSPAAPAGWKVIDSDADGQTWWQGSQGTGWPYSTPYTAMGNGIYDDYLITPRLDLSDSYVNLIWQDRVDYLYNLNQYQVLVSTTDDQVESFVHQVAFVECTNTDWEEHRIDLRQFYGEENVYIAFHHFNSIYSSYAFGIDDFCLEPISEQPVLISQPHYLDFGTVSFGDTVPWQYLQLYNEGLGLLSINLDDILFESGQELFEVDSSVFPIQLPGGQGFDLPIRMRTDSAGYKAETMFLSSTGGQISVSLNGEVLAPGLVIVDIGTIGHGINARFPLGSYYGYERSAALYTSEELGEMNIGLESVAWYANVNEARAVPTRIFLKGVYSDELDNYQDWNSLISGATPVFDQSVPGILAGQWNTFVFDQEFDLQDDMHLLILVERNYGGSGGGSAGGASVPQNYIYQKHLMWMGDGTAPTGGGNFQSTRPCIRLTGMKQPPSRIPNPAVVISPLPNATHIATSTTLKWQSGGGQPSGYKLYFSGNPAGVDTLYLGNVTSWDTPVLEANTTYYWQIVPYNELGDAALCPMWSFSTAPEGTILVGNGDEEVYLPIDPYTNYYYSQTIYKAVDIAAGPGSIENLGYYWHGYEDSPNSKDWKIYMAHTSKNDFSTGGPIDKAYDDTWLMPHELTMVYNGEVNLTGTAGWLSIPLQIPFQYNGVDNLVIGVVENTPGYDTGGGFFMGTVFPWDSCSMKASSSAPIDISNPPYSETSGEYPNIKLEMGPLGTEPVLYVALEKMDFGVGYAGVPSAWQNLVIRNAGAGLLQLDSSHFSFTADSDQHFEMDASVFPIALGADETAQLPLRFNANHGSGDIIGGLNVSFGGWHYLVELKGYAVPAGAVIYGVSDYSERFPFGNYYGYERTVSLYRADQINKTGAINKISWHFAEDFSGTEIPYKIYMGNTTATMLQSISFADQILGFSLVKEGTLSDVQAGWADINLSVPFAHNGENLIVAVETNYGGSGGYNNPWIYQCYNEYSTQMNYMADHNPPTHAGYQASYVPNVMLHFWEPVWNPEIVIEPDRLHFASETSGSFFAEIKVANYDFGDLIFEIDTSQLPEYFNVSPLSGTLSYMDSLYVEVSAVFEDLEPGVYEEVFSVLSNDPAHSVREVIIDYEIVESAVVVDFGAEPESGRPPLAVGFTDLTQVNPNFPNYGIVSWLWDFGDGESSDEQNPLHIYEMPGLYDVTLTVQIATGRPYSLTKEAFINVENSAPIVHTPLDTIEMMSGYIWGPYDLHDIFLDPDGDALEFNARETQHIAVGIYEDKFHLEAAEGWAGIETIMLSATDPFGETATHYVDVTVLEHNALPVISLPNAFFFIRNSEYTVDFAQFISDIDTPMENLGIELISTGGNEEIYFEYLPYNESNIAGQFEVKFYSYLQLSAQRYFILRVYDSYSGYYNEAGFTVQLLEHFTATPHLAADYQYTGESVQFIDATMGNPNYWLWEFGDGDTSEEQNPVHQYLVAGTYTVSLTVGHAGANEEDSVTMPDWIVMQGTAVFEDDELPDTFLLENSPYNIVGGLHIPEGEDLDIEDEVEVVILSEEPIEIDGSINANNVSFTPSDSTGGFWGGLKFMAPSGRNQSSLSNCKIRNAYTALDIASGSHNFAGLEIEIVGGEHLSTSAIKIHGEAAPEMSDIEIKDYAVGIEISGENSRRASTPTLTNIRIRNSTQTNRTDRTGIRVDGDSDLVIDDFDAEELESGIEMENMQASTPTLTNIRIRNSTQTNRNPSRGITIRDVNSVDLTEVDLDDFEQGIIISSEALRAAATPTLTNIRIRNSTQTNRSESYALALVGDIEAVVDSLVIEGYLKGMRYDGGDNASGMRATPTLNNIRIRNSTQTNRDSGPGDIGASFQNLPEFVLSDVKIENFITGLQIDNDESRAGASTPTLTNIRIRNSTQTNRGEDFGLKMLGEVEAMIEDLEIENYTNGIRYVGNASANRAGASTPTLTNIRIRNSTQTNRDLSTGAYFENLPEFSLEDVEIEEFITGLWIEGLENRAGASTPTLTNIRIRNSTQTNRSRNQVRGIVLGEGLEAGLADSKLEGLHIGLEMGGDSRNSLKNNSFINCFTGIKTEATQPPIEISRQLFWVEEDYLDQNAGEDFRAILVAGEGGLKVINNTMVGYLTALANQGSEVMFINNIFWPHAPVNRPFDIESGSLIATYNDIRYTGGVYDGAGNLNVEPYFANLEEVDFGLHYNSPLIDAGSPEYRDEDGTISDIGAFPYLHKIEFSTNQRFITLGTMVEFDSYNIGHDVPGVSAIQWEIGDEVVSAAPGFSHTFNETGYYDLRLKYTTGVLTDEIFYENYIVVSSEQLLPPAELEISRVEDDILLVWQPVLATTEGLPVEIQAYLIYRSPRPDGVFKYLDYSLESEYIHAGGTAENRNFYFVIAYLGTRGELMNFIQQNEYLDARGNRIDTLQKN